MTRESFYEEINTAREFMGSTKTTEKQWENIIKRLGQLAISPETPEDLRYIAEGQLFEAARRKVYVDIRAMA